MPEEISRTEKLENMLDEAQSVSSDAGSVTRRSIRDAIALDEYLTRKRSSKFAVGVGKFQTTSHFGAK